MTGAHEVSARVPHVLKPSEGAEETLALVGLERSGESLHLLRGELELLEEQRHLPGRRTRKL